MFDFFSVRDRLLHFGYELDPSEDSAVEFCIEKVKSKIKNFCNIPDIPEGLCYIAVDMAVGEFLLMKKTFAPSDIKNLDLDNAVKSIQTGDSKVDFDTSLSSSQKFDSFINYLLSYGDGQLLHYRKLRW